jgi:hypothetical protein
VGVRTAWGWVEDVFLAADLIHRTGEARRGLLSSEL